MNVRTHPSMLKSAKERFSPRVAIYGIGFVGKRLVRLIHEKGWEIVGAYNRAGEKVGQDLGRLAGLDTDIGVIVQDYEKADYRHLGADVALIAGPDFLDKAFPIYEKFLKAGINIVSYGSHTYDPYIFHPEIAEKIDALAKENGVTFTGTGLWDMTRIWAGLLATGTSVHIDSIEYSTTTDPARQGVHWFPTVGIGMTVAEYDEKLGRDIDGYSEAKWNGVYKPLGIIILRHCGYTVTDVRMRQEPVVFDEPHYCQTLDKVLPAGICVGTRLLIDTDSVEGVSVHSTIELRLFKPGEIEHSTWKINGLPGMEIRVVRDDSDIAQASSGLNRIPDVLAAEPGIVSIMKLGPLRPSVNL
jgi:2,4-diaminopentanoate dehydrogenase